MESDKNSQLIEVFNKCPNRIWYRLINNTKYSGYDIAPGESKIYSKKDICINIQGQKWETGEEEKWSPTFTSKISSYEFNSNKTNINLVPVFGPRTSDSIKVFMACLAGPADPSSRNDTQLINKFLSIGVPQDNIWMLLEKQCTPKTIQACLENITTNLNEGDILFMYLGGHGTVRNGIYNLATYEGYTSSDEILKVLAKCENEIFMVVDSCYSGNMITDVKKSSITTCKRLSVLASTSSDKKACTGWKLVEILINKIFENDKYTNSKEIMEYTAENLVTQLEGQVAQSYIHVIVNENSNLLFLN